MAEEAISPSANDAAARRAAVAVDRSVIVQAPAGSGKTTLLVERYLSLLACVEAPEAILAITFTRKAAGEMRERVLKVLDPDFASDAPHEQQLVALNRKLRPKISDWGLLSQPQRLMIRTIDSFNHFLARAMPVATQLGPVPAPADDSRASYRATARSVIALADSEDPIAADLVTLLSWVDNHSQQLEVLLTDLLGRREQWLNALSISDGGQRDTLEATLEAIVAERLGVAKESLDQALSRQQIDPQSLLECLRSAGAFLRVNKPEHAVCRLAEASELPRAAVQALPAWQALCEALTVSTGKKFRSKVNRNDGFPPDSAEKADFVAMLTQLEGEPALLSALSGVRTLPAPRYADNQWSTLAALIAVLRRTATELELRFAAEGRTDYIGLGAAALRGLGNEDEGYTDLGLYLDRRIQHILVDEFQDTNYTQYHLLEKLTAGWEPNDGRTLFLVGDPMQSIYRFREAEVGLFLRARSQGIGALRLDPLTLTRNFRARPALVRWVNETLVQVFPTNENIAAGAVRYTASIAGRSESEGESVVTVAAKDDTQEAELLAQLLASRLTAHPEENYRAAIIVKARSHLQQILPALRRHALRYRAVTLEYLLERPVAQDLLALTRALLMPAERTALIALLRAPYCGLTLKALHELAQADDGLLSEEALGRLSGSDRQRAGRVRAALTAAWQLQGDRSFRALLEGAWERLGGPSCYSDADADQRDAKLFFDSLEQAEQAHGLSDWNGLLDRLEKVRTEGDPPSPDVRIDVLTAHGAKGLEWDLVLLPALQKKPPNAEQQLLHWLPFTTADGEDRMLLAPLKSAGDDSHQEPLISLIRAEGRRREQYETQRLLYVAATRAREQLVLSATLPESDDEGPYRPPHGSLLSELWGTVGSRFEAARQTIEQLEPLPGRITESSTSAVPDQTLRRVADDWVPPRSEPLSWQPPLPLREPASAIEYDWAGVSARHTGTVLHRLLERVGQIGIESLTEAERSRLQQRVPVLLRALGIRSEQRSELEARILEGFETALAGDTGRWLLSGTHQEAGCELPLAGFVRGELVNAIIDRTFVAQGVRWIVDYKSGRHEGGNLPGYLAQEAERYGPQLARYRSLFQGLEDRPAVTALYLPMHGELKIVSDERS